MSQSRERSKSHLIVVAGTNAYLISPGSSPLGWGVFTVLSRGGWRGQGEDLRLKGRERETTFRWFGTPLRLGGYAFTSTGRRRPVKLFLGSGQSI